MSPEVAHLSDHGGGAIFEELGNLQEIFPREQRNELLINVERHHPDLLSGSPRICNPLGEPLDDHDFICVPIRISWRVIQDVGQLTRERRRVRG